MQRCDPLWATWPPSWSCCYVAVQVQDGGLEPGKGQVMGVQTVKPGAEGAPGVQDK